MINKHSYTLSMILWLAAIVVTMIGYSVTRHNAFEEGRVVGHSEAAVEDAIRTMEVIDLCTKTTPKVYTVPDDIH